MPLSFPLVGTFDAGLLSFFFAYNLLMVEMVPTEERNCGWIPTVMAHVFCKSNNKKSPEVIKRQHGWFRIFVHGTRCSMHSKAHLLATKSCFRATGRLESVATVDRDAPMFKLEAPFCPFFSRWKIGQQQKLKISLESRKIQWKRRHLLCTMPGP